DHLSATAAGRTRHCTRTRLCAGSLALVTSVEFGDLDLLLGAERGLFKLDLHVVSQIGSAPPIFGTFSPAEKCLENSAANPTAAENFAENLERIVKTAAAKTSAARCKCPVAEAIIGGALVGIHENIVRFPQLFKLLLSAGIVRVLIGVKFHRQLAISALNLLIAGTLWDAKHFVVITFLGSHFQNLYLVQLRPGLGKNSRRPD